ncbi:hypothetical protein BHM03_00051098, partial [Ensete ventricosum]
LVSPVHYEECREGERLIGSREDAADRVEGARDLSRSARPGSLPIPPPNRQVATNGYRVYVLANASSLYLTQSCVCIYSDGLYSSNHTWTTPRLLIRPGLGVGVELSWLVLDFELDSVDLGLGLGQVDVSWVWHDLGTFCVHCYFGCPLPFPVSRNDFGYMLLVRI